jgi:hypothetical protein
MWMAIVTTNSEERHLDHFIARIHRDQFRTIDGRSIRFAESEGGNEHDLLLSPWSEPLRVRTDVVAVRRPHK